MAWLGKLNQRQGAQAERQSADFLRRQGFQILAFNFICKGGEIDLIALSPSKQLHFIEVKARQSADFGHPEEYVTPQKQQRIQKCAGAYLQQNSQFANHAMQFDVITWLGATPECEWIQNAFGGF